jgi:aminoglycoside phosphotransferase (APT) family kinase protein
MTGSPVRMHQHEADVDEALVRRLLDAQMPDLASRGLSIVEPWGTDNAVWRLGDDLVVRLPRVEGARGQVDKENRWLPVIAPHLTVTVPEPVAVGEPAFGYPYRWAVHRWIDGQTAAMEAMRDPAEFALDVANVVRELRTVPTVEAPPPRHRARPLVDYDEPTREAIAGAAHLIDADAALAVWDDALSAPPYDGPAVWVHGDLEGNCLVRDGRLSGIVDWNSACLGDPAIDIQVVWSPLFADESRAAFLDALGVDDATIRRSKGAAVNQACAALPYYLDTYPLIVERSRHKLAVLGIDCRDR